MTLDDALQQVSLVTANFGDGIVMADVLGDWFRFLGGRPGQVVLLDNGSDPATRAATYACFEKGLIDKLVMVRPDHADTGKDRAHIAEHSAPALCTRPYLLFVKMDCLPYRQGHDQWLSEALDHLDRPDTFAVGGSFNVPSQHHDGPWPGWYFSHKCSENFALMKRDTFMASMEEYAGGYISSGFRAANPAALTGQDRYLIELAWEQFIQKHQVYTLVKAEDATWTVFHTNVHEGRLQKVRQDYLARKRVAPYFNAGHRVKLHGGSYYGMPRRPWIEWKMAIGSSLLGPVWRRIKRTFQPLS